MCLCFSSSCLFYVNRWNEFFRVCCTNGPTFHEATLWQKPSLLKCKKHDICENSDGIEVTYFHWSFSNSERRFSQAENQAKSTHVRLIPIQSFFGEKIQTWIIGLHLQAKRSIEKSYYWFFITMKCISYIVWHCIVFWVEVHPFYSFFNRNCLLSKV